MAMEDLCVIAREQTQLQKQLLVVIYSIVVLPCSFLTLNFSMAIRCLICISFENEMFLFFNCTTVKNRARSNSTQCFAYTY